MSGLEYEVEMDESHLEAIIAALETYLDEYGDQPVVKDCVEALDKCISAYNYMHQHETPRTSRYLYGA